jgi:glucosamine-6-phosphate deaminase
MEIRILADSADAIENALEELRGVDAAAGLPLVSFATGKTYAPLFRRIAEDVDRGELDLGAYTGTHPDEFLGHGPDREGGMAHELLFSCPPLETLARRGTFFPVPAVDDPRELVAHGERLSRAGGVVLQFLGLGPNGHIAFNEPSSRVEDGFHCVRLAQSTRRGVRTRFAPAEPPERAITAGIGELLKARRIVLIATGAAKALAVRAMLAGEMASSCPASYLRRHRNVLVLLDRPAASLLGDVASEASEASEES